MRQADDGTLFWPVACTRSDSPESTCVELLASRDCGASRTHLSPIARDPAVVFDETSLSGTPKGDLVAFIRTANLDDYGVLARSRDYELPGSTAMGHLVLRCDPAVRSPARRVGSVGRRGPHANRAVGRLHGNHPGRL